MSVARRSARKKPFYRPAPQEMQPRVQGDQTPHACRWLITGDEAFSRMGSAIGAAQQSVCLESYMFAPGPVAEAMRTALLEAARRGVKVKVLADSWGSQRLPRNFWDPVIAAGGQCRWFNPFSLERLAIRDHRKMLICDDSTAFIGGFNIAQEYAGDGIHQGWRDLGLELQGPIAKEMAQTFEEMFVRSDMRHRRFPRLVRATAHEARYHSEVILLLSGPGWGRNPLKRALLHDFHRTRRLQIISAYFLPTLHLRRAITRVAYRGGQVQIILPAKTDVPLSRLAAQGLYQRLLRSGVEIFEYQPQVLHAKLILTDRSAFVGSSNLDARSLRINYELLLRLSRPEVVEQARAIFEQFKEQSVRIDPKQWRTCRGVWRKWKERWAHFLLVHVDTYIARRQLRTLR